MPRIIHTVRQMYITCPKRSFHLIIKVCKAASFHLYNIRPIRKYLKSESTHCLVRATVIGRIDYCNSLLFKILAVHIAKLQRIQNSAARLVYYIPRFEHITPVLYRLHWLPVSFRIEYKVQSISSCVSGTVERSPI